MAYGICQNKYGTNKCQLAVDKVVQEYQGEPVCKSCGKKLKPVSPPSPPGGFLEWIKEHKRPLFLALIAILLIGGGVFLWKSCEQNSGSSDPMKDGGVDTTQIDTTATCLPDSGGNKTDVSKEGGSDDPRPVGPEPDGIRSVFGGKATYDVNARIINVKGTLTLTDSEGEVITLHKGDVIRGVNVKGGNTMTQGEYVVNGESKLFTGEVPL